MPSVIRASIAAPELFFAVLALLGTAGEPKIHTCALQCTRQEYLGKIEAKCKLLPDTEKMNCSPDDVYNLLKNVSSL